MDAGVSLQSFYAILIRASFDEFRWVLVSFGEFWWVMMVYAVVIGDWNSVLSVAFLIDCCFIQDLCVPCKMEVGISSAIFITAFCLVWFDCVRWCIMPRIMLMSLRFVGCIFIRLLFHWGFVRSLRNGCSTIFFRQFSWRLFWFGLMMCSAYVAYESVENKSSFSQGFCYKCCVVMIWWNSLIVWSISPDSGN